MGDLSVEPVKCGKNLPHGFACGRPDGHDGPCGDPWRPAKQGYATYLGSPAMFELSHACRMLVEAYGHHVYLVGSALSRPDWRDVDVRMILPDEEFARMFPGLEVNALYLDARWSLFCSAISLWLKDKTGLPVDFQVQQRTSANASFSSKGGHRRHALGLFIEPTLRVSDPKGGG